LYVLHSADFLFINLDEEFDSRKKDETSS